MFNLGEIYKLHDWLTGSWHWFSKIAGTWDCFPRFSLDFLLWKINETHVFVITESGHISREVWHYVLFTLNDGILNMYLDGCSLPPTITLAPRGPSSDYAGPYDMNEDNNPLFRAIMIGADTSFKVWVDANLNGNCITAELGTIPGSRQYWWTHCYW